jgi:hypothetical protein
MGYFGGIPMITKGELDWKNHGITVYENSVLTTKEKSHRLLNTSFF